MNESKESSELPPTDPVPPPASIVEDDEARLDRLLSAVTLTDEEREFLLKLRKRLCERLCELGDRRYTLRKQIRALDLLVDHWQEPAQPAPGSEPIKTEEQQQFLPGESVN